jgi:hypothetical protein
VADTSTTQNRLLFFFFFFAAAVYSTNEANKAGLKQSRFLDVYGYIIDVSKNCFVYLFSAALYELFWFKRVLDLGPE